MGRPAKNFEAFGVSMTYPMLADILGMDRKNVQTTAKHAGGVEKLLIKNGIVDEFYLLAAIESVKRDKPAKSDDALATAEATRAICDILEHADEKHAESAQEAAEATQTDEAQTVGTLSTEQTEAAETATEAATGEQSNGGDDVYCRDNNGHWVDVDVEIHEGNMPEEKKEESDMMMIEEVTETAEQVEDFDTEAAVGLEGDKAKLRVLNRLIADLNDETVLQLLGEQADHARALAAHAEGVRIVECIHMLRIDEAMWAKAAE